MQNRILTTGLGPLFENVPPRSAMSAFGRLCCKSPFPLGIKNSPGCRRDFHVKMWGTSSPDDKLTGDLGNAFEAAEIGGRWSDRLLARKLSSGDFGLLQQYRHFSDLGRCPT